MRDATAGNAEAFAQLAHRWRGPLVRWGYRLARNREDAEDICQETLVKAYRSLDRLSEPAKFGVWIHRIALNVYQDRRRWERSRPTVSLEAIEERGEGPSLLDRLAHRSANLADGPAARTPADELEDMELRRSLQKALDTLPEEQREAIVLREFQGFSTAEISEITGVPTATVRTRIFYGLRKLQQVLGRPGKELA